MNTTTAPSSPAATGPWAARLKAQRPRRGLVVALALSLALHGALSLWPAELPAAPDESPLQATIKEMPPPPLPAPVAAAKPRPKPRRAMMRPAKGVSTTPSRYTAKTLPRPAVLRL